MTNQEKMLAAVREAGMDFGWARMFVKKFMDDEDAFHVPEEEKRWAMERGFYPGRVQIYNLTEENYRDYMPDWHYFMIHPINHHFKKWVDDKLTLKYVLNSNGCEDTMPEYYLYVENDGAYTYLMDAPKQISQGKEFIRDLLEYKGSLMMKPNSGTSGGKGIIKLEYIDGQIYENNRLVSEDYFQEMLQHLGNYIVTEYVHQHSELAAIWGKSEHTLRVVMVKDPKEDPYAASNWSCVLCFARFGTSVSGGVSNVSSGGVSVGFDWKTGKYTDFCLREKLCPNGKWILYEHPDTGFIWKGASLPNWETVKEKIYCVCQQICSLDYMGFDIIITENGMKICEINTHPGIDFEQIMCGPTLAQDNAVKFYNHKGLNKFDGKTLYEAYLKSKD